MAACLVPTSLNPLGAKGIGESGTVGSTPAVHNAVIDALSHLGVRHIDGPGWTVQPGSISFRIRGYGRSASRAAVARPVAYVGCWTDP